MILMIFKLKDSLSEKDMIPSAEQCILLMETYGMLKNIRAHSIIVEKVASLIARGVKDAGLPVSLEIVTAGALMHDIGKTMCLNSPLDHAVKGKEICLYNNFPEIAGVVGEHIRLSNYDPDGVISEQEIIYYSDKRVNNDSIVSLEERMDYIFERYAKNDEDLRLRIKENFIICKKVEKKLFTHLDFMPEDLEKKVLEIGS